MVSSTVIWRWQRTFFIIIIILLGSLHILTIPESPHWLVMKQRPTQALKSLVRLRGLQYDCVRERDYLGRGLIRSDTRKAFLN